jgi:hypothetical protein
MRRSLSITVYYRHRLASQQVTFRKVLQKSKFVQIGIGFTYGQLSGARGGAFS